MIEIKDTIKITADERRTKNIEVFYKGKKVPKVVSVEVLKSVIFDLLENQT